MSDQLVCAYMKDQLLNDPLTTLGNWKLTVGLGPGYQTQVQNLYFSAKNDNGRRQMRIGSAAFSRSIPGYINNVNHMVVVTCLATPMRAYNDVHRGDALVRFGANAAEFWVTVRQTGCSVLILDWGGAQYSMVHISPYHNSQINKFHHYFYPTRSTRGGKKRAGWLRDELTRIANASRQTQHGFLNRTIHVNPQRYILVQSSIAFMTGQIQVLGVSQLGQWNFFMQTAQGNNLNATALAWHDWNWYSSYSPAIV